MRLRRTKTDKVNTPFVRLFDQSVPGVDLQFDQFVPGVDLPAADTPTPSR